MTVPLRAALYLRVSTARQAEHDVSIPDQRKQGEAYCLSRGLELVDTFVEAGASATKAQIVDSVITWKHQTTKHSASSQASKGRAKLPKALTFSSAMGGGLGDDSSA